MRKVLRIVEGEVIDTSSGHRRVIGNVKGVRKRERRG